MSDSVIAEHPPDDGQEWECQCARCGSSIARDDATCIGEPLRGDPYDLESSLRDEVRDGVGGPQECISTPRWCRAHPLPGREHVERGAVEWFVVDGSAP